LPDAASQQRTDEVAKKVEAILKQIPEIEYYTMVGGNSILTNTMGSNVAGFFVSLKDWEEREGEESSVSGVMTKLSQKFSAIKEARVFPFAPPPIPGYGNAGGFTFELQDRSGGKIEQLMVETQKF
jgi:HAE1 family hydrophobic/amphiphilic exporter-1